MTGSECGAAHWPFFFSSRFKCGPGPFGGPPPWLFDMLGGMRGRAERGEVRYLVLDSLRERQRHGYEIIQAIEEKSGGAYRPSPGTVYPTLQMLEELGHVRARAEGERRQYEITAEGLADLAAHEDEVEEAYDRLKGGHEWRDADELHELMKRVHQVVRAIGRAFRRGGLGRAKLRRIAAALEEAVRRVEEIVKE